MPKITPRPHDMYFNLNRLMVLRIIGAGLTIFLLSSCGSNNQDLLGKCVHYTGEVYKVTYVERGEITIEKPDYSGVAWSMTRREVLESEISCPAWANR